MARRSTRGRSRTQWLGLTFQGTVDTTAETFEILSETIIANLGGFTLLRTRMLMHAHSIVKVDPGVQFAVGIRRVVLDRVGDSAANIGGTLLDGSYLSNEQLLHFDTYTLSTGAQQRRSDDLITLSVRPAGSWSVDIKAKRRFEDANERLVVDLEAIGIGASNDIDLDIAFRCLIMLH